MNQTPLQDEIRQSAREANSDAMKMIQEPETDEERWEREDAAVEAKMAPIRAKDRRERIATAAMHGLLCNIGAQIHSEGIAKEALNFADALIAALDAPKT